MVVPIADTAAELFYGRLFELQPEYKAMFKNDMTEQGKKLMKTINIAVEALDNLESLIPTLKQMGADHVAYGVQNRDYNVVGASLLWTLEKVWVINLPMKSEMPGVRFMKYCRQ